MMIMMRMMRMISSQMPDYKLLADQDDADQCQAGDHDEQPQLVVEHPPLLLAGLHVCRAFWHLDKYTSALLQPLQARQELVQILACLLSPLEENFINYQVSLHSWAPSLIINLTNKF